MFDNETFRARIDECWPKIAKLQLNKKQQQYYRNEIIKLLTAKNAVLIAHFYVDAQIQQLAEETGGIVADSLEMARFGSENPAKILLIAGVRFMGETAKILSPNKKVLMPDLAATCSLDIGCDVREFKKFINKHSDRTVVVYANTSAAVKACADWVVTSSIAIKVVDYLAAKDEKIIWAPDKYLGNYIQQQTGADMLIWEASCVVHEEFNANLIKKLKAEHPKAAILVHPESPPEVIALADVVGSTSQLLAKSIEMANEEFIVATEAGIFYKMLQASPHKKFIPAGTSCGTGICRACARCPWMALNNLKNLYEALVDEKNEIILDKDIMKKALVPLQRMLDFKYDY